ncbi:MAG TPA: EAL domain-containing protein, partial [Acidimicrobiales bacterium]|nr:EAL domain-containing protein [Acidimicrobiales bacterium]
DVHALARVLDRQVAERTVALAASEGRFRSVVSHVSDLVLLVGRGGEIEYVSPTLTPMSGYTLRDLEVTALIDLVHPDDQVAALAEAVRVKDAPGAQAVVRCRLRRADGVWRDGEITLENLYDDEVVGALVISVSDVTDRLAMERQLQQQALRDDLTGLLNRRGLLARVDDDLHRGGDVTVLLVDLDGFKSVNDSHGHALGDDLLRAVAQRFEHVVGVGGAVARLGGDEFVVVVQGPVDDGVAVAASLVDCLGEPLDASGRSIRCRASIGITDIGETATDRLRNADLAMYEAKALGGGRAVVFHAGLLDRVVRRVVLEDELGRAVAQRALRLVFQPVIDIATEQIIGAEALLRWRRGDEDVSPIELIRVAEEAGLIVGIGRWVLFEACAAAAGWQRADRAISIAVNVSARQLTDGDIVADVADALDASGLDPSLLVLELTETEALTIGPDVLDRLQLLRALGVRISIDDFGTGHSSLGRLRFLPADEVKIDRAFVSTLAEGCTSAPVVDAVLNIARDLHLDVVAEGVELPVQLHCLQQRGCGKAQGFLFAPGVPLDSFEALLDVGPLSRQVS